MRSRAPTGLVSKYVPLALDLTDDMDFVRQLYEDGRKDARSWAVLNDSESEKDASRRKDDKDLTSFWMN
jgi:hypothetical protein